MKSEKEMIYDEQIGPLLMQAGKLCAENGMPIVAAVNYEGEMLGQTAWVPKDAILEMTMLRHLLKVGCNLDGFVLGLIKHANENGIDMSGSLVARAMSGTNEKRKELIPHQLTPPGHILAKELEARGMTFADLGNGDEWDVEYWRRVCEGSQEIRLMSSFIRLEEVLGIPAEFWVNAQMQYSRWVFAKLSEPGQKGSEAGELLRHVTKTLYSPSKFVRARMDAFGIRTYNEKGQCLSIQDIFTQMTDAFRGLSEAELNQELGKIFGERALNTVKSLLKEHT